ncbi:hypothetical protein [Acidovorax sp. K2F]|uniref:hypothetical protein n=1 Tax=Acidovorax sp. K2F TaxID=2978125 RepID=UPI0021B0D1CE|nr:hypothetical protein [Acidovorax sp. K2F]MCT6720633.1 hypothetical protein [Acidovorax sp. K2F]
MAKNPLFMPNPDGSDSYLVNLAGAVLLTADVIFGDPSQTTPQGRTNAMRLVERTLHEAEKNGFLQSSTVWALMRRNDFNPRLKNLVREAVSMIPNDVQGQIIEDLLNTSRTSRPDTPLVTATKHPGQHEPETNPRFTRPGPDGIDPRFWEAGRALRAVMEKEGKAAIHKPEHAHLFAQMHMFAPEAFKQEMAAKAKEMDLLPKATHVGEDGQVVFTSQQIADKHGISVEEVERLIDQAGLDDLYRGPIFPIQ